MSMLMLMSGMISNVMTIMPMTMMVMTMMVMTMMTIEHLCLARVKLSVLYCKRLPRLPKKHRYRPIINNMSFSHRDPYLNLILNWNKSNKYSRTHSKDWTFLFSLKAGDSVRKKRYLIWKISPRKKC